MISIGTLTVRQDIKTADAARRPAARWLLLPIIGFYLTVLFISVWMGVEVVPVVRLNLDTRHLPEKTAILESETRADEEKWRAFEEIQIYIAQKENWAKNSIGSGAVLARLFASVPKEIKLRSFAYEYRPGKDPVPGFVRCQMLVQGNIDISQLASAIRNVDENLVMVNSRRNVTQEGTQLDVEYQLHMNP